MYNLHNEKNAALLGIQLGYVDSSMQYNNSLISSHRFLQYNRELLINFMYIEL